jgi:hypothetical protein
MAGGELRRWWRRAYRLLVEQHQRQLGRLFVPGFSRAYVALYVSNHITGATARCHNVPCVGGSHDCVPNNPGRDPI